MNIIKIKQKNSDWIETLGNYNFIEMELKKGKPKLQLIYNNQRTERLIYECDNCKKLIETSWYKFLNNQYQKNKCLCQKCSMSQDNVKELISKNTKLAMKNEKVKNNCSNAQKERWKREEEINKRKLISKEIINRDGMIEFISSRTKCEMNKLNTKEIRNPYKNMDEKTKKDYLYKVGKSISNNYNEQTKVKTNTTRTKSFKNNLNMQNKIIFSTKNRLMKERSQIQKMVSNYILNIKRFDFDEEFVINLYNNENYNMSFIIIDFANEQFKYAIEVLGNYYHDGIIEHLKGESKENILKNCNDFKKNRFIRDLERDSYFKDNQWKILYITEDELFNSNWMLKIDNFVNNINL